MRLEKFNKNKTIYYKVGIVVVLLIGITISLVLYHSFAYFEETKSFNILEGKVPTINRGDVKFAVYVDNDKSDTIPSKDSSYVFVENPESCTNGASIKWEENLWAPTVLNLTKSGTTCTLYFETKLYEEEILAGSYPVIKEDLVPVVIADDGTVARADIRNEWYSYANSKWANAVILSVTDNYAVGATIPESAIESYFVWIPKYRYKLFNVEGEIMDAQEIEIQFGDYDTVNSSTECIATNVSGDIGTCANNKWMTHPAFTSLGVTGFWVGKFETGYKGSTDTESAQVNETAPKQVQIKPNIHSWVKTSNYNSFNTSLKYKGNLDSHQMKSTEWGAVAYLTNSKYGRGNTEVWINNNSQKVTGCVGDSVSESSYNGCQNKYNTTTGYHGSTTDNITGIYDMSGCGWDKVMGVLNDTIASSGFTSMPNIRYYNKYLGSDYSYKILGDATAETKGWNNDQTNFVNPWDYRGGNYTTTNGSGVFSFSYASGGSNEAFRIVLSPSK